MTKQQDYLFDEVAAHLGAGCEVIACFGGLELHVARIEEHPMDGISICEDADGHRWEVYEGSISAFRLVDMAL